jgi:hypothetical protein
MMILDTAQILLRETVQKIQHKPSSAMVSTWLCVEPAPNYDGSASNVGRQLNLYRSARDTRGFGERKHRKTLPSLKLGFAES